MIDVSLYETGIGGDLILKGNDVEKTSSLWNMIYIALFGGNVQQSTPTTRPENEQAFDWWGNALLIPNTPEAQYNSLTERALNEAVLNSAGRVKLEQIVKRDLKFMEAFTSVTVAVTLDGIDRVKIAVKVDEPTNQQDRQFVYIWDATKSEVITDVNLPSIGTYTPITGGGVGSAQVGSSFQVG